MNHFQFEATQDSDTGRWGIINWACGSKQRVKQTVKELNGWGKKDMAKAKLGSGKRFAAVEKSAKKSGARNPAAVAAAAGIKKYGAKKMEKMAAKGRKKK